MKYEKDDLYFIGMQTNDGEYTYQGKAIPSKLALNLLGDEKIAEIDRRIKEMIDWKTIIYGYENDQKNGFPRILQFADYPTRSILDVGYTIDEFFDQKPVNQTEFVYDKKLITLQNTNILKDITHYLIRVNQVLSNREFFQHLNAFDCV